jgi:hypothetical protein
VIDRAGSFRQDGDMRQAGAEVVVQIARNAGPLVLQCLCPFELRDPGARAAELDLSHTDGGQEE